MEASSRGSVALSENRATEEALDDIERSVAGAPKHATYTFNADEAEAAVDVDLGESSATGTTAADIPMTKARQMIKLGALLGRIAGRPTHRQHAVNSLKQALETKLLMDELEPSEGNFAQPLSKGTVVHELGEDHIAPGNMPPFKTVLAKGANNMLVITKYLLERKKAGFPLTSKEDGDLQKFYYQRASGILKKILRLKRGDVKQPKEDSFSETDEEDMKENAEERAAQTEILKARDHADAVVDKLNFDSKLAIANAKYNKEMVTIRMRRAKAAIEERQQAESQELKAAKDKLAYDEKVANAESNYNQVLSSELTHRKQKAERNVRKAASAKHAADVAAEAASRAAREADREAKVAELEAEAATKRAEKLEAEEAAKEKLRKSRVRGHTHAAPAKPKKKAPVEIPLTIVPQTHLAGLLRYLQSALNHHTKISAQEQQLMQSFFLTKGSTLLSELAQVNPDATWHSKGVVAEEQYEMDQSHPDQLSREWGSKHLKGDTVVTDFVHDALWAKADNTKLARPDANQQLIGLMGSKHKIGLKFALDTSAPETSEPDLGETYHFGDDVEVVKPQKGALSSMMGIN
jgi:hypothetical protein